MYKVDLKTLEEITKTLDVLSSIDILSSEVTSSNFLEFQKAIKKAKNLSQKIKDNYTEVKIS
jgi:hypothetical protein